MRTVKDCADELLQQVVGHDANGRAIGHGYDVIRVLMPKKFPCVVYKGPHYGKATLFNVKELQSIAYELQLEPGIRLPRRPRRRVKSRAKQ